MNTTQENNRCADIDASRESPSSASGDSLYGERGGTGAGAGGGCERGLSWARWRRLLAGAPPGRSLRRTSADPFTRSFWRGVAWGSERRCAAADRAAQAALRAPRAEWTGPRSRAVDRAGWSGRPPCNGSASAPCTPVTSRLQKRLTTGDPALVMQYKVNYSTVSRIKMRTYNDKFAWILYAFS